jgi:adenylate cyclase
VRINFRGGPRTFPAVPFHRVVNGDVPPGTFAGKIVLVGATTHVLHDVFPTPFASEGTMPGVEIHANVIDTLLQGIPIRHASPTIVRILTVLAGLFSVWAATRLHPLAAFGLVAGGVLGYLAVCHAAFVAGRYWMEAVPVPVALGAGYFGSVVRDFIREQRERRRLSRFFSPEVVKEIVRHKDDTTLDSGRRRLTVLFSDIRGFTSISERMSPEEVVTFLREYLTEMTDAVFKHGGTIDKYMGDGIMALYNVPFESPDHAARAVWTALEFQDRLRPLAERFAARHGGSLRCGVGINTGEAVVGTIGSTQRLEYTAIGDAVNLGSRLESVTKDYNVPIIVSEETWQEVKHLFAMRYLDEVKVKGKEIAVRIYAVLGPLAAEAPTETAVTASAPVPGHSIGGLPSTVTSTSRSPSK